MKEKIIYISGMTCKGCERIIERSLEHRVEEINANYEKSKVIVRFDEDNITLDEIFEAIKQKGYIPKLTKPKKTKLHLSIAAGLAFLIFGAYIIVKSTIGFDFFPDLTKEASLGILFFLGLLTGFHCMGMCGGFVISYATKSKNKWRSHFGYGAGKTIGYAAIGGLFGLFGSFIAFTPQLRGYAAIFAGLFLVIFGLNMLNIFPWLKKVRIKSPKFLNKYAAESHKSKNPFKIGLLNSLLIACGPLQAMYIYAAGTGSMIDGALSLAAFGLGTLPVLIGFGVITSLISSNSTKKILKISAIVIMILGAVMMNRGVALTGSGYDANSLISGNLVGSNYDDLPSDEVAVLKEGYQEIRMDVLYSGWSPNKFVLQKGIPVKWIVNGIEITGCNNAIQVPKYGLDFDVTPGEKIIEFTPSESGTIAWSCWMGMIPGTFIVVDDLANVSPTELEKAVPPPSGGSCGSNGGSCGCGGGR